MKVGDLSAKVKYTHPRIVAWAAWLSAVTQVGWFLEEAIRQCLKVEGATVKEVRVKVENAPAIVDGRWRVLEEMPRRVTCYLCPRCRHSWEFSGSDAPAGCPACHVRFIGIDGSAGEPFTGIVEETRAEAIAEALGGYVKDPPRGSLRVHTHAVYLTQEMRDGICYYGVWQGTGGNPGSSLFEVNNNLRALCPYLYTEALGTAMAVAAWEGLAVRDLTRGEATLCAHPTS